MNKEYCSFDKVFNDIYSICDDKDADCLDDDKIIANLKANFFPIMVKLETVWEMITKDDVETDAEIIKLVDTLGETYGSLVSYVVGFDKRFNGKAHQYRSLSFPKIDSISLPEMKLPEFNFPKFF